MITLVTDRAELDQLNVPPDIPAAVVVRDLSPHTDIVLSVELLREIVAQYDAMRQ
jgi:hypothetical protein